jgi:hypothetical protein
MELAKYKACICEGSAEEAIIDILVDNDLLIFKREEMLEEEGLIERIEYQQIPPKVEYKLSDIGEKFRKVLKELEIWGNEYIQYLNDKE